MTYLGHEISRRLLPVVTFVLISFLISGKFVRARPQEDFVATSRSSNIDGGAASSSSEIKEVVTEKTDPEIATAESDNRYNRSFIPSETPHAMYTFLKNRVGSPLIWSLIDPRFLRAFRNCVAASSLPGEFLSPQNTKRVLLYLKKIKTKIKDRHPAARTLQRSLRAAFQQINAKNQTTGDHFKFFVLILFLRLFTILKSCKSTFRPKFVRDRNPTVASEYDPEVLLYVERILHIYTKTLEHSKCQNVVDFKRVKRSLWDDRSYASHDFSFNSKIPLKVEERLPYTDSVYRDELIASFLANSLPDLNVPTSMVEPDKRKTYFTTSTPLFVDEVDTLHLPKPEATLLINSVVPTPSTFDNRWSTPSTPVLQPVPLLSNKPSVSQRPPLHLSTESHIKWKPPSSPNYISSQTSPENGQWIAAGSHYHKPPSDDPNTRPVSSIQVIDDTVLHFPYPSPPPTDLSTTPTYETPIFVEPIVVSSVDQLPPDYPVPAINASLGHDPVSVQIDSKPPEIVVLEDINIQSTVAIDQGAVPPTAGASADGVPSGVAEAPAAGAGVAPAVAAGSGLGAAAALAAAAAALGAVGSVGVAAGIGAGVGAGSAAAAAAGASAAGGGGGGGDDAGEAGADGTVDAAAGGSISPTDVVPYSPATATTAEDEIEAAIAEIYDLIIYIFSLRFVYNIANAVYSIVVPHVSFLVTSGFTIIAFLFPWLYPHIVVPVTSFLSSLT